MTQRDIRKIDKTVLDNFYKLVHSQANVRLTSATSTYKIIDSMKKKNPEAFNEHLNYCLDRLVSGLASSRAFARQGYGTLLLELLNNYQISTERLFTIAQQKFGNISNETTRDNLLGYFLLISIVLESGNYRKNKSNTQYLEKMYKYLTQLKNIKSYFDYPVSKLLTGHYELFHPFLLVDIKPHAFGTDAKISQNELLVITLCNKKEPLRDFLNLDSAEFMNLSSTLLDERLQRKPLHPVWAEFAKLVMSNLPQYFELFCNNYLFPVFFKPNHNELAAMGLELISSLLEVANDTSTIKALLSDYVIRLIILSLRNRTSLHSHCNEFFQSLKRYFERALSGDLKDNKDALDRHYFILSRLTSAPGSVAFDEDSKSASITNLLNSSNPYILNRYIDKLLALLDRKFGTEETKRIHLACTKQISHIIRRPQMSEQFNTSVKLAKFLIINSLFKHEADAAGDGEFWNKNNLPKPISISDESTRVALKNAYHATMDHLISACNTLQRIEHLGLLIEFSNELMKLKSIQWHNNEQQEIDITDLWSFYMTSLTKHRKFVKKQPESKQLLPITNLYLFYGLQIIEYGFDCKELLDELAKSAEESCKGDPNDGSWADLLTDQIIAILSATECSPWMRKFCNSVFGSLLPHISEASIDVLCKELGGDESDCDDTDGEDESMSEDGDGDDDDEDGESVDDNDENENDSTDRMSVDDDDDTPVEDETSGKRMKTVDFTAFKDKLEVGANNDDDDEEEEEYLDDEQMMKLDSVLADMFKLNRVGKSKSQEALPHKLRCLDLVKKIVLKKHNDAELMKKILKTLVPLAAKSRKSAETRPIADKINTLIAKMPGKSKLTCVK